MATTIEAQGQTVDEAIQIALNQLGVSRDKVEIDILHHPRRGLLGIGARRAKVRATIRESIMLDGEEFDMSGGASLDDKPRRRRRRGGRNRTGGREGERPAVAAAPPASGRDAARAEGGRAEGRPDGGRVEGRAEGGRPEGRGDGERRGDGARGREGDRRGRGRSDRGERRGDPRRGEARTGEQPRGDGQRQVEQPGGRQGERDVARQGEPREGGRAGDQRGQQRGRQQQGERRDRGSEGASRQEGGPRAQESRAQDADAAVAEQGQPIRQPAPPRRPPPVDEAPLDAAALDAIRARAEELVRELLQKMGFAAEVTSSIDEAAGEAVVSVRSENEGLLIGRRGQTLDSLEHIVNRMALRGDQYVEGRVLLDIGDYRRRRRESLEELATRLRSRAVSERRTVQVSPMSPRDRKFFALAFGGDESVEVRALGAGFYRRVIVAPAGMGAAAAAAAESVSSQGDDESADTAFAEADAES